MFKDKFLKLIKQRYASQGLSDKVAETIYELIGSTITDESLIETEINRVENLVKSFQGQEDARVQTAITKTKAEKTEPIQPPKEQPIQAPAPITPEGQNSEMFKILNETIANLAKKLDGIETGKVTETRKSKFMDSVKEMPESFKNPIVKNFDRLVNTFKDEEEYSAFLAEIKTDYEVYQTDLTKQGVTNFPKPNFGNGKVTNQIDEKTAMEIALSL